MAGVARDTASAELPGGRERRWVVSNDRPGTRSEARPPPHATSSPGTTDYSDPGGDRRPDRDTAQRHPRTTRRPEQRTDAIGGPAWRRQSPGITDGILIVSGGGTGDLIGTTTVAIQSRRGSREQQHHLRQRRPVHGMASSWQRERQRATFDRHGHAGRRRKRRTTSSDNVASATIGGISSGRPDGTTSIGGDGCRRCNTASATTAATASGPSAERATASAPTRSARTAASASTSGRRRDAERRRATATPAPNNLQNFPVLTTATGGASTTIIDGSLDRPPGPIGCEFFANAACDGTNGEGAALPR